MRAETTAADYTSIRVSWEWSHQGVLMCVNNVTIDYQPEGGSLVMYMGASTTAIGVTLPSIQCNTKYTIWVRASGGGKNRTSAPVFLPARGMHTLCNLLHHHCDGHSWRTQEGGCNISSTTSGVARSQTTPGHRTHFLFSDTCAQYRSSRV